MEVPPNSDLPTPSVTLVLGAGGAAAWVFHAGVLTTLARETGWDPQQAELVIGTSAGAAVAAALRAGISLSEIVESVTRGPSDEERQALTEEMAGQKRSFRPLSPGLFRHALPLGGGNGVAVAVAGLLPPGQFPTSGLGRFVGVNQHDGWPEGLWIPAVRAQDGEVVVFGRDRTDVSVADAVEASSAIPGLFRPKMIDGVEHLDGGLASPTHAYLAAEGDPDLVVISSPMTRPSRRPMARLARRRLSPERRQLDARGLPTMVIQPPREAAELFRGFPRRNRGAAPAIVGMAADATRRALREPSVVTVVGRLSS